jgi:alanyl-tRNA synthetase
VTEKLYYRDPQMLEFDSRTVDVAERDGRCEVELEATCFYPGGGGQPCDRGTIGGVRVVEVSARDERIVHLLESPIAAGAVHGSVDAARRHDFMAQHTGQHIFSQALVRAAGLETVSVHLGDDDVTIELNTAAVNDATLRAAEDIANGIIRENRPVLRHEIDRSELSRFPLRRTPPDVQRLSIVEVKDFDWAACAGVHVASTGEVFLARAAWQEKIRGHARIHVMMGRRAFDDYGRKLSLVQELCASLTCGEQFVAARVQELLKKEKESSRELRRLQLGQAIADADDSVSAAKTIGGAVCVRRVFNDAGGDYLKAFVERVVEVPGRIAIGVDRGTDSFQWIVAHSLGAGLSLSDVIPGLLSVGGARGGGKADRMQGAGTRNDAIALFVDALEGGILGKLEGRAS